MALDTYLTAQAHKSVAIPANVTLFQNGALSQLSLQKFLLPNVCEEMDIKDHPGFRQEKEKIYT